MLLTLSFLVAMFNDFDNRCSPIPSDKILCEVGVDIQKMAAHYQCKRFTELSSDMFDVIIKALESKRK